MQKTATVLMPLRIYYFAIFGALGLYLPYFPAWLEAQGFRGVTMSAIASLMPALSLAAPPMTGMLADRLGLRGGLVTFAAVGTALGLTLLWFLSGTFSPLPFWPVFASVFVFAAFRGTLTGLADVIAIETAPNYGRMRLFGSLGFLTTALLGGHFVDIESPTELPLLIMAALWLVVLVSRVLPRTSSLPPRPALADARALLRQPGFRWLLLTVVLIFANVSAYDLCSSLRMRELGASGTYIGVFWAVATGAEVILLYWAAPFVRGHGPGKLLVLSSLVAAFRWAFLAKATSLVWIMALQPLHALTFGMMWVSAMATVKREVGERGTATAQGLYASALAVGATIGMWVWGPLYASHGAEVVFTAASGVAFVAALVGTRLIRWTRPST